MVFTKQHHKYAYPWNSTASTQAIHVTALVLNFNFFLPWFTKCKRLTGPFVFSIFPQRYFLFLPIWNQIYQNVCVLWDTKKSNIFISDPRFIHFLHGVNQFNQINQNICASMVWDNKIVFLFDMYVWDYLADALIVAFYFIFFMHSCRDIS